MKRFAAVLALPIVLAACNSDTTGPNALPQFDKGGVAKVTICHRDDAGHFNAITVGEPAVAAHMAHGDGQPNSSLADHSGTFDGGCVLTRLVLDYTTSYNGVMGGGGGGSPFNDPCQPGSVGVGVSGYAGSYFGWSALWGHTMACAQLLGDGTLGAVMNTPVRSTAYGNTSGPYSGTCSGGVLVGYEGWQAWLVNRLIGQCASIPTVLAGGSFTSQIGPFSWNYGAGWYSSYGTTCNAGYVVTGTFGDSGDILDGVGFTCTKVVKQTVT